MSFASIVTRNLEGDSINESNGDYQLTVSDFEAPSCIYKSLLEKDNYENCSGR